jgi:hypothetical protein
MIAAISEDPMSFKVIIFWACLCILFPSGQLALCFITTTYFHAKRFDPPIGMQVLYRTDCMCSP